MDTKYKIYAGLIIAGVLAAGLVGGSAWSNYKIDNLEKAVETAKQEAVKREQSAARIEQTAAEYRQKTQYLEESLAEIQTIARKQDEELENLSNETNHFRGGVRHARAVRTIQSTTDELCAKLGELGHPCE